MANMVQYYVFKRPKHPTTGEIIRGKASGATKNADNSINTGATVWYPAALTTPAIQPTGGSNGTLMSVTAPFTEAGRGQVDGEPWILHSTHFSLDDSIAAAKPVVSAVGSENVKILKGIAHELVVKLV